MLLVKIVNEENIFHKNKIIKVFIVNIIYLEITRLNSIEIRKNLNRCNFEGNDFRSMNERPLETRNFAL